MTSHTAQHPQTLFGLIPITFTDSKFDGGALTNAVLEIEEFNTTSSETVELTRLVFDESDPTSSLNDVVAGGTNTVIGSTDNGVYTPAAIPEPSGLALLALGAAGILARRRLGKTA